MPSRRIKQSLFQIFWKSDLNLIIFGGGYTFIIFFLVQRAYRVITSGGPYACGIEAVLMYMDILCYIHFPLMFLATINFFTLEKRNTYDEVLDEVSVKYRDRAKKIVLLWINSFICLFFICLQVIYLTQLSIFLFRYFVTSIFHIIYIFGGVGYLAIELGMLLAKIPKKNFRSISFLILNLLLGYPFLWLNQNFLLWWSDSYSVAPIKYIFLEFINVLPEGILTTSDGYGCHAIEVHKFCLLFSWIFICYLCNILLYHFHVRKKKIAMILAITVICCICSILPYGKIDGTGQRTFNKYFVKYEKNIKQVQSQEVLKEQEFEVVSYSMDFYVSVNLYARVEIMVSNENLNTYCFTLLEDYNVLSIKNQDGTCLDFEQEGDYLYVYAGSDTTSSLVFQYYGAAAPLYTDFNGIYLPAGVPFFPMPGINDVYDEVDDGSGNVFYCEIHLPDTKFEVNVHTIGKVYSSLEEREDNQFYGKSDGFFLLAGSVFTNEVDNVTFYYPAITYEYVPKSEIVEVQQNFIEYMNVLLENKGQGSLEDKKVLVMWMTYYNDGLDVFDDFVGVNSIQIDSYTKELYQNILAFL